MIHQNYSVLVYEKKNQSLVLIEDSEFQPLAGLFKWETLQSLVSHLSGRPSAWDFPISSEHQ